MIRGAEHEATERDGGDGAEQHASYLDATIGRRDVSRIIAGEDGDLDVLASPVEPVDHVLGPAHQTLLPTTSGDHVLGASDVPRPVTARLHHDKRDDAHAFPPR